MSKSKKRFIRYGLLASNVTLVLVVISFIVSTRNSEPSSQAPILNLAAERVISSPLDEISGADIAVNVALMVDMPQTASVINNADEHADNQLAALSGNQSISRPQIVSTDIKSVKDIQEYVVVSGDKISDLAKRFGVTSDSLRWSNGLVGSAEFKVDTTITVPPVDGFVYSVKDGDTTESLASRFSADESAIIAFNDIEITGLVADSKIMIPNGKKPSPRSGGATQGRTFRSAPVYGGNGYDYGYCTFYVANKVQVPNNWRDAKWWDDHAAVTPGWGVIYSPGPGEVPAGAILVSNRGYYGHVAYVESVNPDGSLFISEMNAGWNWNVTSSRTLPASSLSAYNFVVRN